VFLLLYTPQVYSHSQTNELIYQGADLGNATATAVVHTWDGSNKILSL
jgi:hypothetical protein